MVTSWVRGLGRSQAGRQALFERLVGDCHNKAYGLAYRLTNNASEADDLLQETYLRAYRFWHRYDESLPFLGWLYRIMTNIHIDAVRRRQKLKTVSLDQPRGLGAAPWDFATGDLNPDQSLTKDLLSEPIERGLQSLNAEFRTAVVLADVEGMAYEEIASVMKTSIGTVRSRIHRGRRQLRSYLEGADK